MKKCFPFVSWAVLVMVGLMMTSNPISAAEGAYRHVVFFKFKNDASQEAVKEVEEAFIELSKKVDTVTGFEWGTNVSPEGLNDGFTHCFLVTFKDKAGLEVYLPHPEHEKFVSKLKPLLDKVCVLDYVAK
jgi:quinol monooxygenase YgiN